MRRHDADDPRGKAERIACGDQSADSRPATDRHVDSVQRWNRPEQLERVSADAGHDLRLERADKPHPALAREQCRVLARLVEIAAVLDQLGTERAHRAVLVARIAVRNDNDTPHGVAARGEREALPVIAARCGDDPGGRLTTRGECGDEIQAATYLERTPGCMVLVPDPDPA